MPSTEMLDAALDYGAAGIPVFPCVPDGKEPLCTHGFKEATTDPAQITTWWTRHPCANIGIRPAAAGQIVLDVDRYKGGIDQELLDQLPDTYSVPSPNGGEHLYFATSITAGNKRFAPNIDVRSASGYVLVPPSRVNGKSYRPASNCGEIAPLPDWAEKRLRHRTEPPDGLGNIDASDTDGCSEPAIGHYREHPAGFDASLRADIERVFDKPPPSDPEPATATKRKNRFGGRTASEGEKLPPITYWDWDELLPRIPGEGCVGYLIGESGTHKTGTAIMLALDAIETEGAKVLYIAAEGALGVEKVRVPAARRARGMSLEKLDAHWRVESETFNLLSETDRADLIAAYREFTPDMVIVDVMTLVAPGADINTQQTATAIRDGAGAIASAFGATVLLVHHPSRRGLSAGGSGSALFKQQAYFELHTSYKDRVITLWVDKMKDGQAQRTIRFKHVDDEDGVPVIRAMTTAELVEHKAKRPPQPNIEAENATDESAVNRLAEDVTAVLRTLSVPTPLRDIALRMNGADEDTASEAGEKRIQATIRRLQRAIGTDATPGVLYPFAIRAQKGRRSALEKPYRLFLPTPDNDSHDTPFADTAS